MTGRELIQEILKLSNLDAPVEIRLVERNVGMAVVREKCVPLTRVQYQNFKQDPIRVCGEMSVVEKTQWLEVM